MTPGGPEGDRIDHDAWTSGLLAAATGAHHPVAGAVLELHGDVERAVGAMPRAVRRAARRDARHGGTGLRATLRDGAPELDVTVTAEDGRTWVRVAHGDASVLISVEPLGRRARTGLVRSIDAPPGLARSMLRRLGAAWADLGPSTFRSPTRQVGGPPHSTTTADGGQINARCT